MASQASKRLLELDLRQSAARASPQFCGRVVATSYQRGAEKTAMSQQEQDPLPPPPDPAKFGGQLAIDLVCFALGIVGATIALVALDLGCGFAIAAFAAFAAAVALSRFLRRVFGVDHLSRTEHSAHQAFGGMESIEAEGTDDTTGG